jgi:hypothetical protein
LSPEIAMLRGLVLGNILAAWKQAHGTIDGALGASRFCPRHAARLRVETELALDAMRGKL